jgi:hypothetical protein
MASRMNDRRARLHALSEWLIEFSVLWAVFPLLDRLVEGRSIEIELACWSVGISLTTLVASLILRKGTD